MSTLAAVMAELKKKGSEQTRKTYERHDPGTKNMFGVKVADLKVIVKKIKGQQALACELFATGNYDAMYLAGLVANGKEMTARQLDQWVKGASRTRIIAEYSVPFVTVENPDARKIALRWMKSSKELIAAAGWATYSDLLALTADSELHQKEIQSLLETIVKSIHTAPNRVKMTMNRFVIAVGSYVKPLSEAAKAAATKIGELSVSVGDTACKVPAAAGYIEKMEKNGRAFKKRKTTRC